MHPDPRFHAEGDLIARVAAIGFAHVFVAGDAPMLVHVPVTRHGAALRFHLARSNGVAPHLDGATVLLSVAGPDGYVSPQWYAAPRDQVPTWNYVAIEIEGRCAAIDDTALTEQLDALAATHEPNAGPAAPWTRDKMDPDRFAAMLGGIRGFEIAVTAVRGTEKLSQNKSIIDRLRVAAGLRDAGRHAIAAAVQDAAQARHA